MGAEFNFREERSMSTVLRTAAIDRWILPRPKKCPPDTFCTSLRTGAGLSNPIIAEKRSTPNGVLLFSGVDNGIRTHDLQSHNLTR